MSKSTRSGEFRYPIVVQRIKASATKDTYGQVDQTAADNWETFCSRRAKKETQPGTEAWLGDQVTPVSGHILTVRSDADTKAITTLMRVIYDGRTLNIQSAENVGYRLQEVRLVLKE